SRPAAWRRCGDSSNSPAPRIAGAGPAPIAAPRGLRLADGRSTASTATDAAAPSDVPAYTAAGIVDDVILGVSLQTVAVIAIGQRTSSSCFSTASDSVCA